MPPNKLPFDDSLTALRNTSRRITEGLDQVISVLQEIGEENRSFLRQPVDEKPTTGDSQQTDSPEGVEDVIESLRQRIEEIAKLGQDFDEKMSEHASVIVSMREQLEESKKIALLDPLTNIANRRKFEDTLEFMLETIGDYQGKMAVLLADIDAFKEINDTLGHHVGDQVLKLVSKTFVDNLKGADLIARWGGDEFSAILPRTNAENAAKVAENVRSALASKNIVNRITGEKLGKVTLSVGTTMYKEGDSMFTIMDRADKAMYKAKHTGKNKVVVDGHE